MALNLSSLKAMTSLLQNKVKLEHASQNYFFLTVDETEVTFDRRKEIWTCSCEHEAWRGSNLEKTCYHLKAAKHFMEKYMENKE